MIAWVEDVGVAFFREYGYGLMPRTHHYGWGPRTSSRLDGQELGTWNVAWRIVSVSTADTSTLNGYLRGGKEKKREAKKRKEKDWCVLPLLAGISK